MAKHEKHLLILIVALLLTGLTWVLIGAFVTRQSPISLMSNFYHSLIWGGFIIFFFVGLAGFYYEVTLISKGIALFETDNEPYPVTDEHARDIGLGLYVGLVLLGFVFGIDEAGILEGMQNVLLASLGFSLSLSLALLGAVVARKRRERG